MKTRRVIAIVIFMCCMFGCSADQMEVVKTKEGEKVTIILDTVGNAMDRTWRGGLKPPLRFMAPMREPLQHLKRIGIAKNQDKDTWNMITVGTFSKPEEAHLLRMRLEAGGVHAFIQDENLVQLHWLYSNAIGGVRVQIAEADREQAVAILNEAQNHEPPDAVDPACPFCGSTDVAPDELPRRIAFAMLIVLSFPLLFGRTKYRCASCRRKWNEKRDVPPAHRGVS